jgi:transcription antitermination factor NusG
MAITRSCNWYAIRVRPRSEKMVAAGLHEKQYEAFLPLYRTRNKWSDRLKDIELPLCPGYVFCRADLSGKPSLITTPGVIGLLCFGGVPAMISDEEIEAVRVMIRSGSSVEPWPYLREGQYVLIEHGALSGLRGLLVRKKSSWRVVVSIELLDRSVAVEVDRDWIVPAPPVTTTTSECHQPRLSPR